MDLDEVADQLRRPSGENGETVALNMNKSNFLLYQMTLDVLALQPGDNVLEIGMGNGHLVPELFRREQGIHYTGVDFSEDMIAAARRFNTGLVFHHAPADKMPVGDGQFNKVFCVNVLYFWEQPSRVLSEISRILQPEGQLVLAFRSKDSMLSLPFVNSNFILYDADAAKKLLEDNGFKVTAVTTAVEQERVRLENICMCAVKI
jgi:SAM-dependent methyltransferase